MPILPGIMPLNAYAGFKRMTGFCKTRIPPEMKAAMEPIKDDTPAFQAWGVKCVGRGREHERGREPGGESERGGESEA